MSDVIEISMDGEILTLVDETEILIIAEVGMPGPPGPQGPEGPAGAGIEIYAHKSDISNSVARRFIIVTTDETNNNDTSLYLHNGTALKFLLTIE